MAEYEVVVYQRIRQVYRVQAESENEALHHAWNDENLISAEVQYSQPIWAEKVAP